MKCLLGLGAGRLPTPFDLIAEFTGHGKKAGINQDTIAEACKAAHRAMMRWLKKDAAGKKSGKPRRKSRRNKVTSLTYGLASGVALPVKHRVRVPGFGKIRCSKFGDVPEGKIKGGRLVKRASGYYFQFVIDAEHTQEVKPGAPAVGIDPGFKTLLTLSDGIKFENPRELRKTEKRLAQAQRGGNKGLTTRLQERAKRQRRDRNHKISHAVVKNYSSIFYSDDSFKAMQRHFGKSVNEAGLSDLIRMLAYKALSSGRLIQAVSNYFSTQVCSACGARTGPKGVAELGVREWTCRACGARHDRGVNAARNTLISGQGMATGVKASLRSERDAKTRAYVPTP